MQTHTSIPTIKRFQLYSVLITIFLISVPRPFKWMVTCPTCHQTTIWTFQIVINSTGVHPLFTQGQTGSIPLHRSRHNLSNDLSHGHVKHHPTDPPQFDHAHPIPQRTKPTHPPEVTTPTHLPTTSNPPTQLQNGKSGIFQNELVSHENKCFLITVFFIDSYFLAYEEQIWSL